MLKISLKWSVIFTSLAILGGCSGVFDTDNTPTPKPLESIKAEFNPVLSWSTSVGQNNDHWLKQTPALYNNILYTSSDSGDVYAINAVTGQSLWHVRVDGPIANGPAVSHNMVIVANRMGKVFALNASDGSIKWKQNVNTEILSSPAIDSDIAIVKTGDGEVRAFNPETGSPTWTYRQTEPTLGLHSAGTPRLYQNQLYVGFSNGNLVKLSATSGTALWVKAVTTAEGAFAIERMIDVDADLALHHDRIFAASFQGKIASFDTRSGQLLWSRALSSYTGMATDGDTLFVTDATGVLWAFDAHTGREAFRQSDLLARGLSAPVLIGNHVVVGDKLGYLHWFNKKTGRIIARASLGSAIQATPVVDNNQLFVLTQNGRLNAYKQ